MATFSNQASLSYGGTITNSNVVEGELITGLSITKTALTSAYSQNGSITYLVTVTNDRTVPYAGLTLTDDLGASGGIAAPLSYVDGSLLYYQNGTLGSGASALGGPPLVITNFTIPAGGNATFIYQATPNGNAPFVQGSTITNTATLSGAGLDEPLNASATVSSFDEARLTIAKAVCPAVISDNGQITYTFVVQNSGNVAVVATDNAVISDTFDPALSEITVTLNGVTLTYPADYTYNEATGEFATNEGVLTVPAATYGTDPVTGNVTVSPGVSVLTVSGTLIA